MRSSLHKNSKRVPRNDTHSATSGLVILCMHTIINPTSCPCVILCSDLIMPHIRGGRSLDNLHRVSTGESDVQSTCSLGDPGTCVSLVNLSLTVHFLFHQSWIWLQRVL